MAVCKGCGARILWGLADGGRTRVPLDLSAPVYTTVGRLNIGDETVGVARLRGTYVSHFSTCPKATEMKSKKRSTNPKGATP